MNKNKTTLNSIKAALLGIKLAFQTEKNIKIHFIISILTLLTSFLLEVSAIESTLILMCIGFVLSLELINTAIERIIDLYSTKYTLSIKIIKDIAAGSVLIASIFAFTVGCLIFIPKCLKYIELWK
tara:strand:+ start:123 stop:500 length:378 start_codon:yes stop_codon:yes gene_type:complete